MASRTLAAAAAAAALTASAGSCLAQADLVSLQTLHGVLDLRAATADGERSFTDGGFGKSRYGDGSKAQLALAALEWTPRLSWEWSAVVDLIAQPGQEHPVDLSQAYLQYRPAPRSRTRFSARAGLYYPAISLEHDARAWGLTDTITPSAIDSWVGEELKVAGVEATVSHDFDGWALAGTAGVFGDDDTSGALLAFRGWSLSDVQSQARGGFELPPLSPFIDRKQADETYTSLEIDRRAGWYARGEWRSGPVRLNAFWYDNAGDMTSVTPDHQWTWATRFLDLGLEWQAAQRLRILAQAMDGRTVMGFATSRGRFVDTTFRSAYLLGTASLGQSALTARADVFSTRDETSPLFGDTGETGWALTGAWRRPLTRLLDLRLEALHLDSTRPARALALEAPRQAQDVLQSSLRLSF